MRRREFVIGCGLALAPLAVRAQHPDRPRRVGVLMGQPAGDREASLEQTAFDGGLREHGWAIGRNIEVAYRFAAGDPDQARNFAKELVALPCDVIVGHTVPVVAALVRETSIPIVFISVNDPVGLGYVASFSRPAGNVTGFTNTEASISGKWVEVLHEIAPRVATVAVIFNPKTAAGGGTFFMPALDARVNSAGMLAPYETNPPLATWKGSG